MPKDTIVTPASTNTDATNSMLTVLGTQSAEDTRKMFAAASHADKLAALQKVSEYIGAPTVKIDDYLGHRLELLGLVIQRNATVKLKEPIQLPDGTVEEYGHEDRVVWKVKPAKGDAFVISFMSMAIAGFCESFLIPLFGQGDFDSPVPLMVRQTTNGDKRTYNVQVIA